MTETIRSQRDANESLSGDQSSLSNSEDGGGKGVVNVRFHSGVATQSAQDVVKVLREDAATPDPVG